MDELEEFSHEDSHRYYISSQHTTSDDLTPWQQTSTNFLTKPEEPYILQRCNLVTEPSSRGAIIKKRRASRATHRKTAQKISQACQNPPTTNVISPRLCYASITNMNHKQAHSTQIFREGLDDKENIMRLKQSINEVRRNYRLQKIIKLVNPRRTNSILMERSRLRFIVNEELGDSCKKNEYSLNKSENNTSLSNTKNYKSKLEQHIFLLNREPRKKSSVKQELKFLPDVTKLLYEKYSLNKTRSSFHGRLLV